jgi:hypothetical protein
VLGFEPAPAPLSTAQVLKQGTTFRWCSSKFSPFYRNGGGRRI